MYTSENIVNIWRKLRSPFALPSVTAQCHLCEWEKIEIDVLGCTLCGKVHACAYGVCKNVVDTSDGIVCELSGIVIYSKRYVETEFMDTMCVTGRDIIDHESTAGDVELIVQSLLCSKRQSRVKYSLFLSTLEKNSSICERQLRQSGNAMAVCIHLLSLFSNTPYVFAYVDPEQRQKLVGVVVEHCVRILHMLTKHGMNIRNNEVQRLAVGIMYLMRCGVTMDGVFVLPRLKELETMLPPETSLFDAFGVHPKYITEMENRLKYCLRHVNA